MRSWPFLCLTLLTLESRNVDFLASSFHFPATRLFPLKLKHRVAAACPPSRTSLAFIYASPLCISLSKSGDERIIMPLSSPRRKDEKTHQGTFLTPLSFLLSYRLVSSPLVSVLLRVAQSFSPSHETIPLIRKVTSNTKLFNPIGQDRKVMSLILLHLFFGGISFPFPAVFVFPLRYLFFSAFIHLLPLLHLLSYSSSSSFSSSTS